MSITILIVTFCGNCDSSERTDTKSERGIRLDIESIYPNCIESDMNIDTNDNDKHKAKGMYCVFFSKNLIQQRISVVKALAMMTSTSDDDTYVNRRVNNNISSIIQISNLRTISSTKTLAKCQ